LGAGSYGAVFKALDVANLRIFAVKEVTLEELGHDDAKHVERVVEEARILKSLRHTNIVSYLGHECVGQSLLLFLEFVPGGSLASLVSDFGALEGAALRKASTGIAQGLDYLHTRSPPVVHRDLKGANVLVDLNLVAKLSDFGCSKWSSDTTSFTMLGSVPWMAPEVIDHGEGHGRSADIWSFGCTLIEIASAQKPWGNGAFDNMLHALNRIASSDETPPLPEGVPDECGELIARCTQRSPQRRPNTAELLQHTFLSTVPGASRRQSDVRARRASRCAQV